MKTAILSLGGSATKQLCLPPCMSSTKDNGDSLPLRGAPRRRRSSVSPSPLGSIVCLGGSSTKRLRLSPWLSSAKENVDSLPLCGSPRRRRSSVSLCLSSVRFCLSVALYDGEGALRWWVSSNQKIDLFVVFDQVWVLINFLFLCLCCEMDGSKTFSFGLSKERRGRFSEQRTPITIQVSLPLSSVMVSLKWLWLIIGPLDLDELVLSLLSLMVVSNNGVVVTFVGVSIGLLEIDVVLGVINEL
ncbi:hypothetical protein HID58_068069 [Brassica napus]|uniref:Uncharacterized protein n=1 Tax=Brassica napus TaxID=3708 RepID=A0ABQ7ZKX4_BRANA|nr:hypothetical protein HID58_068069 [Brassica napus]